MLTFEEVLLTLGELKLVIESKPTGNMHSIIITTDKGIFLIISFWRH